MSCLSNYGGQWIVLGDELSYLLLVSMSCQSMSCQVDELAADEFSPHQSIHYKSDQ